MATIVRPSPRHLKKVLCIWALEGPRAQQVILSRQILHHEGAEDVLVQGIGYNGVFDSWMVFQAPAVCHLFHAFDLHATAEAVRKEWVRWGVPQQFLCFLVTSSRGQAIGCPE